MNGTLAAAGVPELGGVLDEVQGPGEHPLVFATVSGAHLYGFPSRDSDVDLRGAHLLPTADLVGLREPEETRTRMWERNGEELDLVTHDLRKFVRLMLKRNGYVLEQLLSPLVAHSSPVHAELAALAPGVLTRHHAHHYLGFSGTQWRLHENSGELKPLLYAYRALLTGIHLMRGGEVCAHLPTLAEAVPEAPARLPELIAAKAEAEHGAAAGLVDGETARAEVAALRAVLEEARLTTSLPEQGGGHEELHDLLVRVRSEGVLG
ncbi:nucleotidyltransferase domain-containing protein [Streptomyces sp. ODS28]|uniref:nucleotidyltransferase domain-containing protein n=1 Tax=Streptomyces sp. ODS28 TaxID=3136688 RepID=UPI0031E6BAD9